MIAILQACEEADKAKEEEAKAKEEAVKAEEEAAKAKEEAAKNFQENPSTHEDCSWDDLDDPHFCCQSRTNFSRVLDQLKQLHVDFGYCAGVADHLHEEPTPSQEDVQPPPTHAKNTKSRTQKTVATAAKRVQDEAGDPRATKKRRICRHVRFSLPAVKRPAMDEETDVSRAKRRRNNTTDSGPYSEMEFLQWIEHEKRVFRKAMVAEAQHYNDMVRLQRQFWKTPQVQPRGASPAGVSQANPRCSPVVTSANATAMETDCAPSIIPIVIKSANETTCPPPIIPVVVESAKETTCPPPIIPVVVKSAKETTISPPVIIPVVVKSAKVNTCRPPLIPVATKSAKENSRPAIVPVVDASAKRRRH
ncbi:unnamed protein product [Aphanomyces euteiches]